ncbi:MAG: isoprenylcysteine carboxylmethyltransferase family protein [Gemmatimonadetes bacterium]|nr:isoprenylcysteine carboxylmethyltransferase family protein [Gemmatimonadota bacterium]
MHRWFALLVLASAIGISGFHRHRARRDGDVIARSREAGWLIAGRLSIALPLFLSVLAYIANPRWMAWSAFAAPVWLRHAGVVVGVVAIPAVWWVFSSLGRNVSETVLTKREHALVTSGPYRWIRHPLYATGIAVFSSIGLVAANAFILIMASIALLAIRVVVIPREEAALLDRFGASYRAYMARSGRLLPRLR